ncbi:hypothetical protein ACFV6I_24145, partial [Kitasatospora sp. NPDC059803]
WLAERWGRWEDLQRHVVKECGAPHPHTAAREPALAAELASFFADERPDGPTGRLVRELAGLFAVPGIAEAVTALATAPSGETSPQATGETAAAPIG